LVEIEGDAKVPTKCGEEKVMEKNGGRETKKSSVNWLCEGDGKKELR
jgi:hypothetical protein